LEIARRYRASLLIADIVSEEERQSAEYMRVNDGVEEEIRKSSHQPMDAEIRAPRGNVMIKRGAIDSLLSVGTAQQTADLIVIGTHGRTGLKKTSEGSKAEEIAHSVPVPVLTIGPKVSRGPEFKRLLFVTDFSSTAAKVVPYAALLAREYGARLDVLHVNDPSTEESPREAAEGMAKFVRDEIRDHGFGDVLGREELQFGERAERILQFAVDQNVDLIVAGQKHTSGFLARIAAHLPGGVAYNVAAEAHCAVLTVPESARALQENESEPN
jgi:nucleotide-binding universal stress UspA family protein